MKFLEPYMVPTLVSFLIGVGIAAYIGGTFLFIATLVFLSALLIVVVGLSVNKKLLLIAALCLLGVSLGVLRFLHWKEAEPRS